MPINCRRQTVSLVIVVLTFSFASPIHAQRLQPAGMVAAPAHTASERATDPSAVHESASSHSSRPIIIGAVVGAIIGGYVGAVAIGSCESRECTSGNSAMPVLGVVIGTGIGALIGVLFSVATE